MHSRRRRGDRHRVARPPGAAAALQAGDRQRAPALRGARPADGRRLQAERHVVRRPLLRHRRREGPPRSDDRRRRDRRKQSHDPAQSRASWQPGRREGLGSEEGGRQQDGPVAQDAVDMRGRSERRRHRQVSRRQRRRCQQDRRVWQIGAALRRPQEHDRSCRVSAGRWRRCDNKRQQGHVASSLRLRRLEDPGENAPPRGGCRSPRVHH